MKVPARGGQACDPSSILGIPTEEKVFDSKSFVIQNTKITHLKFSVYMENEDLRVLAPKEISKKIADCPGWIYADNKISKQFEFDSFLQAIEFINLLTPFFERVDHHADIHIYYKKIVFDLQRFSAGGKVTERDFTVAREIDRLYENRDM